MRACAACWVLIALAVAPAAVSADEDENRRCTDPQTQAEILHERAADLEEAGRLEAAIQVRVELLRQYPTSTLAPDAVFDIGRNYEELGAYDRAAKFYERRGELYARNDEKAEQALWRSAELRRRLGDPERAVEAYRKYLRGPPDHYGPLEHESEAVYRLARLHERRGSTERAAKRFREYLEEYADEGSPDRRLQARVREGVNRWKSGDRERARELFRKTLEDYGTMWDERRRELESGHDAAARATFMLAEALRREMRAAEVDDTDVRSLERSLKRKIRLERRARERYLDVLEFEGDRWKSAAQFEIGRQYEHLADVVREVCIPVRMRQRRSATEAPEKRRSETTAENGADTADDSISEAAVQEQFRRMLENDPEVFEERAVRAYRRAMEIAHRTRTYDAYTDRAADRLAQLRPDRYGTPSELRARPNRLRRGYTRSSFLLEREPTDGDRSRREVAADFLE